MAGREITALSSPEEIAEAQRQLAEAQQRIRAWTEAQINDPRRVREGQTATAEHIQLLQQDVQLGIIDSVPLVGEPLTSADAFSINANLGIGYTPVEQSQEMRRIASDYDYVTVGDLSSSGVGANGTLQQTISGYTLFVPGLDENAQSSGVSAPSTSLSGSDDAALPTTPTAPEFPSTAAEFPSGGSPAQAYTGTDFSGTDGVRDLDDTAVGGFDQGQLSIAATPVTVTGEELGQTTPENNPFDPLDPNASDAELLPPVATGLDEDLVDPELPSTGLDEEVEGTIEDPDRDSDEGDGEGDGDSPTNSDAVDVSDLATPSQGGSGSSYEQNKPSVELRPNVLHDYANWSYGIGLYMLTPEAHANMVQNGGVTDPNTELSGLLIRSGGHGGRGSLGDKRDYHIENFRFTSVVGQNSRTARSSNNFDISFEIVEPYGVAFLSELVQLASYNGIEDHFETPYLLEIKFNGYDEQGNPIPEIPGSGPKYIPIKIINLTFNITSAATIYTVTAVPYAHSPLQNQHDAIIQESISLQGNTFNDLMTSLFEYLNNSERAMAQEQNRNPDLYDFVIHDSDLRDSRVGFEHITDGNVISIDRQSYDEFGDLREIIQINAGSTLKSAIQAIAGATDFGARFNTVGQPESASGNENRPLRLLKIMPVIARLGQYNTSTKRYSREVIFRIDTQRMYGFVLPDMPGARPTERGWLKEYNWLFTGRNQDILDFEAEYNVQYFNIRNVFTQAKGNVVGTPSAAGNTLPDDGLTRTSAGGRTYSPSIVPVTNPITNSIQNTFRGAAHQLASDHMDNVLNNPGADMMVVNLTVVGDPDFIPQDLSILPSLRSGSGNSRIINGSIATDVHDIFVMLKFKTPRDYDPEKGLMKIDTDQTFVQGLYRVITLESNFYDGRFEQTLRMIRVQNQVSNDAENIPEELTTATPYQQVGGTGATAVGNEGDGLRGGPPPGTGSLEAAQQTRPSSQIRRDNRVEITGPEVDPEDLPAGSVSRRDSRITPTSETVETPAESYVPIGTVSSSRIPGQVGLIRSGDEFNALDAISEQDRIYREREE